VEESALVERDAVADPLTAARAAFDRHEWEAAYAGLTAADADPPLSPADLVRLADAAKWSGRAGEVLALLERAAEGFTADGERRGAAAVMMDLARQHWQRGDEAVAAGCAVRAAQLLEGLPECPEQGLLEALGAYAILELGDIEGGLARARAAVDIGRRTGSRDVEALGLLWEGHGLLAAGRVDEGRARIDEANACAVAGGLGLDAAGQIFCSTLWACRNVGDWGRAGEWTQVSLRWCERQRVNGFPGLCRFHRAEVMRVHGALDDAEHDARAAIDELLVAAPRNAGWGFMELGEIQRRRGDLDEAGRSFARALELGTDPEPGLALLEFDRGDVDAAATCIRRATADPSAFGREAQSTVLPATVTIELAAGQPDRARDAARELRSLADTCATPATNAAATRAAGELALADGDVAAAVELLERAWRLWCDVDAPFEAAQTRLLLADAHRRRDDRANATVQVEAAARTFERLGARRETQRARHLLDVDAPDGHGEKTFMFTDIVDSTKLLEAMGDEAWQPLLAWHDRTLRACFEAHRGTEVKHEGDGFFVAFDSPSDALASAAAIQRQLADQRQAHGFAPPVRIGVHTAAATERNGDYFGRGVHEAARVAAQAGANEVLASEATLAAADPVDVTERRRVDLKGVPEPVAVATVRWR
jgi:class 3 adenylate cyclase